jgi:hypothetical protein
VVVEHVEVEPAKTAGTVPNQEFGVLEVIMARK